jgi:hypothetical protein
MANEERWLAHGAMSDPGSERSRFAGLPSEVGDLCRTVQGVLIHSDWLAAYGVSAQHYETVSRETLPLADRLKQIGTVDDRALAIERVNERRVVGTCRDYALMMCGMLREQGVAARVRCGFAAYFRDGWEDHWICEYERAGRWHRADAQLDGVIAPRLKVGFDPTDLPDEQFVTADEAWRRCRSGQVDPSRFGHGAEARGLWFVRVNVVRDHLSLNGRERSDWDTWRQATPRDQVLSDADCVMTDRIAAHPDATPGEAANRPSWAPASS